MKLRSLLEKVPGARVGSDWLDRRRLNHLKECLSTMAGKGQFQDFFEELNQFVFLGMNVGNASKPECSGEKAALEYINQRLNSLAQLTIFDVGANVGNYSILIKEVFGEKAFIHSFEPSHKTFQKLALNLAGKTKIELHNFGLGNENTKQTLFSDSDESGIASIYKRKLDHFNVSMSQSEEVEIKTLDAFCRDHKIEHIHFLKLDVEGHEIKVLDGASRMLYSRSIDFIQFEFGGCNIDSRTYFQDFYYRLKDSYKIYRIVKDGVHPINQYKEMYEAFILTNYLAEKK